MGEKETPERKPPPRGFRRRFGNTLVFGALLVLSCGMPFAGYLGAVFGVAWLVYGGYSLSRALEHPAERRLRLGRLLIWTASFALVFGLHKYYAVQARADAERTIAQVSMFRQRHGRFPDDSAEAALQLPGIAPLSNATYFIYQGRHLITYHDPWMPFTTIRYDLDTCTWSNQSS